MNRPPCDEERNNPLRVAVGNGLRADVWEEFSRRFDIPYIREFYSATEAPGAIFNLTGKVGSIGHVPMRRLGALKLARYDVERDELARDSAGHCIECEPGEVGELLIRLKDKPMSALGDFRGYTDEDATQKKVLRDVFREGDRFFRSGDLMRFDENDYFYFVDRIGDTYRWKGENVSTAEVAEVIGKAHGVRAATVASIPLPGMEGAAGMAALECDGELDVEGFWKVVRTLPAYAQPRFIRVLPELSTTGTFKIQKTRLRADGVDPVAGGGPTVRAPGRRLRAAHRGALERHRGRPAQALSHAPRSLDARHLRARIEQRAVGCKCSKSTSGAPAPSASAPRYVGAPFRAELARFAARCPSFGAASVAVPVGAVEPRSIVIALHGGADRPEWQCGVWRSIAGPQAIRAVSTGRRAGRALWLGYPGADDS